MKPSFTNVIIALSVVCGTVFATSTYADNGNGVVQHPPIKSGQHLAPKMVTAATKTAIAATKTIPTTAPKSLRLVSFAPSCTELVKSINAENSLVGICKFCPEPTASSAKVERVGDFNSANIERLTRLKPDMVLVVSGQEALLHTLKTNKFAAQSFPNSSLADISRNLLELGKLTNREVEASHKAKDFDLAIQELKKICSNPKHTPSVFYCVWPQPLMTAGKYSFLNDALLTCGGKNIGSDLNAAYAQCSLEKLVFANPDVVIMPYEATSSEYVKRDPWVTLKAYKEHRFFFLEKEESDRLSRPSTRVVTGLYWLASRLHPEKKSELTSWLKRNQGLEKLNY
jgi:iron complex transport system substrate-binding protein